METNELYDKEAIYDEEIAPLMKQIYQICKREALPMIATFYLQEERETDGTPMYSTSILLPPKAEMNHEAYDWLKNVDIALKHGPNGPPIIMTSIIRTS